MMRIGRRTLREHGRVAAPRSDDTSWVAHPLRLCFSQRVGLSFASRGDVGRRTLRKLRAELACCEIFQGAKAAVEFGGRQAALAIENTQKIRGGHVAFECVAFDAAGNQVAVGIASEARAWHDVVQALHVTGSAAEAVKAGAAFSIVNGFTERPGF